MMKSITVFSLTSILFFSVSYAEIYTWSDSKGTVHFSEDPGRAPKDLRNKIRKIDEIEQPQTDNMVNTKEALPGANPYATSKEQSTDGVYDGKSYEQWQQELADSEAALIVVRRRIDELADQLKYARARSEEQKHLFAEYNPLLEKFKAMKSEYYQLVAAARKVGLTVNIQEQ